MITHVAGRPTPCAGDAVLHAGVAAQPGHGVVREFTLTDVPVPGEPASAALRRIASELHACEARLLSLMIYGGLGARAEIEQAMREALGPVEWPVTWIDGALGGAPRERALAGLQAFAVSGVSVMRVRLGRRVVGSVYSDGNARHCLLGGLGPTAHGLPAAAQTQQTLGNLEWALGLADFALGDVVRTWFYNDDILSWYGDFNRVRSALYQSVAWRTGSLPASTGIGAKNPAGAALVLGAWAMQPLDAGACAREIPSPLQCPAPAYGSAFARAMELCSGGLRRLLVSGTASIHPDGRTAWPGDPEKQVALTMEVIAAILHARGMAYRDVTRATAYIAHPACQTRFDAWRRERELTRLPVVCLPAEVCRGDLLFELELDAATPL